MSIKTPSREMLHAMRWWDAVRLVNITSCKLESWSSSRLVVMVRGKVLVAGRRSPHEGPKNGLEVCEVRLGRPSRPSPPPLPPRCPSRRLSHTAVAYAGAKPVLLQSKPPKPGPAMLVPQGCMMAALDTGMETMAALTCGGL